MKNKKREYAYTDVHTAHNIRRALINSGTTVSLIAYNPNTDRYVFDAYYTVKDKDDE